MEIKTLKSFVTVANLKNFSAAARELNTVQPAISRHISDLEEELGVRLFWRNSREVKITAAGRRLLGDAMDILARENRARQQVCLAAEGKTGRLRIGYLGPACFSFIPDLVRSYSTTFPEVQISLREMTVRQQADAFAAGQLDVGFSRPMSNAERKGFAAKEIYLDTLIAVLPETHSLVNTKSLRLRSLEADPFILFKRFQAVGLFDMIISACQKEKFAPVISSEPENMQTVLTEVAAGLGVSVVPGCVRRMYTKGCVFLPIQNRYLTVPTELHYRPEPPEPTVEAFVELTMENRRVIQNQMMK